MAICTRIVLALSLAVAVAVAADLRSLRAGCTLGDFHSVGEEWTTNGYDGCEKYICKGVDVVSVISCAPVNAPLGCSVVDGNMSGQYPRCCPRKDCSSRLDSAAATPTATTSTTTTSTATTTTLSSSTGGSVRDTTTPVPANITEKSSH